MKLLMCGFAASISVMASDLRAELILNVDGEDYPLSALMENCQSLADDPAAQISCFSAVSKLVENQAAQEKESNASVPENLEALRAAAQYQDDETGLTIVGTGCDIQFIYYGDYFHISRRNVSSIDLFSVKFDAADLQFDEMSEIRGAQVPLVGGEMNDGALADMRGDIAIESSEYGFEPKSARQSIGDYAVEVANQLAPYETSRFEFVLVHPAMNQSTDEIWTAFEAFLTACNG